MPPSSLNNLIGGGAETKKTESKSFDKDMFLQLLVAQMRYQNPLKPMEQSEFMAQATQLASVEALQAVQTSQAEMAQGQRSLAAASLVGRSVSGRSLDGEAVSGVVDRVLISETGISLVVDGSTLPLSSVTSVEAPATSA